MISEVDFLNYSLTQLFALARTNSVAHQGNESLEEIRALLVAAGYPSTVNFPAATNTWGDGSAGAIVFDGSTAVSGASRSGSVYTLTAPLFATTIVINSGVTVRPNNWPMFGKVSFVNNGTVESIGNAGNANGTGGTSPASGTTGLYASGPGGAGAIAAGGVSLGLGAGFGCGQSGAGGLGPSGAGGAAPTNQLGSWPYRIYGPLLTGQVYLANTSLVIGQAKGGSGGGGDGTNKGGGGGASGGLVVIVSPSIKNNGTIDVTGGAGGSPTTGNAGGGGGGGGGCIVAISASAWTAGTRTVAGGAGGTPVGTGVAGAAGAAGNSYNIVVG